MTDDLVSKTVSLKEYLCTRKVLAARRVRHYPFKHDAWETVQVQVYSVFPFKIWLSTDSIYFLVTETTPQ